MRRLCWRYATAQRGGNVERQLREVGIEMELRESEPTTALNAARNGDFDMQLFNRTYGGSGGDPDASVTLPSDGLNNFSHCRNPEADKLIDSGAAEMDPEKRKRIYSDLQKLIAEEVPFLYIRHWETALHFNKRIKGVPEKLHQPVPAIPEIPQLLDRRGVSVLNTLLQAGASLSRSVHAPLCAGPPGPRTRRGVSRNDARLRHPASGAA